MELAREGTTLVERRFWTEPAAETLTFASEREATRAYHERTAELFETKWRRISRCESLDELAPNPALAAAAATGDPDAIAVYNDWLLDHGDARGELATLRVAPTSPEITARIAEVEREHGIELFGLLAVLGPAWWAQFALEWRHGWIDKVTAQHRFMTDGRAMTAAESREALHHLLHAPAARFLRHLVLDPDFARAARTTLADCPHCAGIRTLTLLGWAAPTGDLMSAFPELRRLELFGNLDGPGHPRVETLALTMVGSSSELVGEWPAVRRLELALVDHEHAASLISSAGILRVPRLAGVTDLAVSGTRAISAQMIDTLVDSPLFRHLERLAVTAPLHSSLRERLRAATTARGIALALG